MPFLHPMTRPCSAHADMVRVIVLPAVLCRALAGLCDRKSRIQQKLITEKADPRCAE